MFFALRRSRHTTSFLAKNSQVDWGRATHLPFWPKICESAPFLAEVMPHTFLFRQKSATQLPFSLQTAWLEASSIASKGIPCAFLPIKGSPHEHKREQPCEQNTSHPPPDNTALAPPSPSLLRLPILHNEGNLPLAETLLAQRKKPCLF